MRLGAGVKKKKSFLSVTVSRPDVFHFSDPLFRKCCFDVFTDMPDFALPRMQTCVRHWLSREISKAVTVFRIRISFHADPGSQKCPYGSGSRTLVFLSDPNYFEKRTFKWVYILF